MRPVLKRGDMVKLVVFVLLCGAVGFAAFGLSSGVGQAEERWLGVSLHSRNALLVEFYSGEILHYQNGTARMYPASLVKMMTALVAIENIGDLNEMVFLDEAMFQPIHSANATTAGFLPNDSVRAIDLLFGLLLPSGAECAVGLALHVAGSEDAFVALMNERARELGMSGTNFTNTTGLHNSNQFSTAKDMAILLRYALDNEVFKRIISGARHSTADTSLRPGGITFHSTLFSRMASPEFYNGNILGGRTGFTSQAGQNLASFARVNGATYILVTSGAQTGGNHLTQALHIEDAFAMFEALGAEGR
jgi:D-alanyl-D-alanine carboxypeptidase (penicillin-binding protein 5/6)